MKPSMNLLANRVVFLLILAIVVGIAMGFISPAFLSWSNIMGMTQFGAVIALLAIGQSLVILGGRGGIDLSVGSTLSLSGVMFGMLVIRGGVNIWVAAFLALVFAAFLGSITGFLIAVLKMPPLIGSLGTMYTYAAIALVWTNGIPLSGFPDSFQFLGQSTLLGIPAQVILVVVPVFVVLHLMMTRTMFGREIYLVGVNDVAARLTGINVIRTRFLLYVISAVLSGIGAIIMASWLMTARPDVGNGFELRAITIAVLGGINVVGGEGTLLGTLLSVLIITMIGYGLQLGNINSVWQLGVLGGILLAAIISNQMIEKRSKTVRA